VKISGLILDRRPSLKSLIGDVMLGKADFDCILVYDVSRWGRFQNNDESAHYEFICKEAGVRVEYCAEEFANDGSLMSNVMKSLKRAMAAEYSRELSTKVFAAQCRLIEKGFRQGGAPGYGLRRLLLGGDGQPKGILEAGQRKHLQTDRVIIQPGPEPELSVVREIFRQFVFEQKSESAIARELNQEGVSNGRGRAWTHQSVRYLLNNENYVGVNVYNRKTTRLGSKMRNNSPNQWLRAPCTFAPIIDPEIFDRAQRHRKHRRIMLSNREMLARLESLLREKGRLSASLINEAEHLPDCSTYALRFGSLRNAYKLIKHRPRTNFRYVDRSVFLTTKVRETAADLIKLVEQGNGSAVFDQAAEIITINSTITVSIYIARCMHIPGGGFMWRIYRRRYLQGDWIVALRPDLPCRKIIDFLLLPTLGFPKGRAEFSNRNPARLAACRYDGVAALFPKILTQPQEPYVPLAPHSSTRCGIAKMVPKPGKRRNRH
jgi:DNA invertase Pin-like site-specific DNA recombinase